MTVGDRVGEHSASVQVAFRENFGALAKVRFELRFFVNTEVLGGAGANGEEEACPLHGEWLFPNPPIPPLLILQ